MRHIYRSLQTATVCALLTACAPGVSIYPGLYCTGQINAGISEGATLYDSFSAAAGELAEKCGLMLNVKVKSWAGGVGRCGGRLCRRVP